MERKEFLRSLGAGAAFAVLFPCASGCSSNRREALETFEEPSGVDFVIDLANPDYAALGTNGGFVLVISNSSDGLTDIVVAPLMEMAAAGAAQVSRVTRTRTTAMVFNGLWIL